MITPEDDLPLHQAPVPIGQSMGGHPNAYDRFFLSGYGETFQFGVALGLYPHRHVIDAAFSVRANGVQRSLFASERLDDRRTAVGPLRIEVVEPMRVNRVVVDAPDHGVEADLTYTASAPAAEEPRLTIPNGPGVLLDFTRATQLGTWRGTIVTPEATLTLDGDLGTKDRSWGVRPVGEPLPGAPGPRPPQICFFWATLHFPAAKDAPLTHALFSSFEDERGVPYGRHGFVIPTTGPVAAKAARLDVVGQPGTRWPARATLHLDDEAIALEPVGTFFMRGLGYTHPQYGHGRFHGGPVVGSDVIDLGEIDPLEFTHLHVEQVVRATWGARSGLGLLETFVIGPQEVLGLTGLLDPFGAA